MYGCVHVCMCMQVLQEAGPGLIDEAFVFPPHVVKYPNHTITSGVLVTLLAAFLAGSLVAYEKVVPYTCAWAALTW
jgi:hypothetical protein